MALCVHPGLCTKRKTLDPLWIKRFLWWCLLDSKDSLGEENEDQMNTRVGGFETSLKSHPLYSVVSHRKHVSIQTSINPKKR